MTQPSDITLANQVGSSYRAEHNSINLGFGSTHKGSTAPSYAVAGMMWVHDTADPWELKIYDGEDWILMGTVDTTTNLFIPANSVSEADDNTFTGKNAFADAGELTISSGAITITAVSHTVDTEANAATDELATINGGADGEIVIIRPANDARSVVIKNGTGNIITNTVGDITLASTDDFALLTYDAQKLKWAVLSRNLGADTYPPIGMPFPLWDNLTGVTAPDNSGTAKFIKLTAGESGTGGYNDDLLTSESVSGSAPEVTATAQIVGGDLDGQTVHLINTEESFLRARTNSGVKQNDQMQRLTGAVNTFADATGAGLLNDGNFDVNGVFNAGSTTIDQNLGQNGTGRELDFDSAGSPNARTSSSTNGETRSKNVSATFYMRVQ